VKELTVHDLTIEFDGRPDGLAVLGEALGQAGISIEGGALFTVDGRAVAHFLVADGVAAQRTLTEAGLTVTAVREALIRRLDQGTPGQLGAIARAVTDAGASIDTQYSDHANQLILLTSDQAAAAAATRPWTP
jgi:hypothetical protein